MSPSSDLIAHAARLKPQSLQNLSADAVSEPVYAAGWQVDLSRHYLDTASWADLLTHGKQAGLNQAINALFSAEIVNTSEARPALHWALRGTGHQGEAADVHETTQAALSKARALLSENRFKTIVHVGIGGSDFGPRLLADAFADLQIPNLDLRFCANVDPLDLDLALHGLDPATTLVIGISKSFGTEETLYNLTRARNWLQAALGARAAENLLLVTANPDRARAWLDGAAVDTLHMPASVGGRYSLWSAASVAIMMAFGPDTFEQFLNGAAEMDQHVRLTPLASNMAVCLALLDYWNTSLLGFGSRAVLAYSRRLRMLPTYLQQLEMESNGKSVTPNGHAVATDTAPLLWGGEGSVGQHSYHQWLHQGTHNVPTEFILAPGSQSDAEGVTALTAHALAQAEVLANGRSLEDIKTEEPDLSPEIAAQKVHPGGRPSTFLHTPTLTPQRLGGLIALYEHRTYLAGVLWGINSFDQWGVERGKTMAGRLKTALAGTDEATDPATQRLLQALKAP